VAVCSDYDVINYIDFEQLPGTDQIPRHFNVGLARRRIPARVVVSYRNCRCGADYGRSEDFTSMNEQGIHRANGH